MAKVKDTTTVTAKQLREFINNAIFEAADAAVAERDKATEALAVAASNRFAGTSAEAVYKAWADACQQAVIGEAARDDVNAKIQKHEAVIAANRAKRAEAEANGTPVPAELSEDSDDDDENFETANA